MTKRAAPVAMGIALAVSALPAAITFDSSMECGNGTDFRDLGGGEVSFAIERDSDSDDNQWFLFDVSGASGETITFHLEGIDQTNVPEHWADAVPMASADGGETWRHVTGSTEAGETRFTFTHTITGDPELIAFHRPYTFTRAQAQAALWASHPDVSLQTIGESVEGRPIELLTVSAGPATEEGRVGVWIICREHAAEVTGSWMLEGFMDFLLSEDARAITLRDRFVFNIVPCINPDGVALGNYRDNARGVNLNVVWGEPTPDCPEVPAVERAIEAWVQSGLPYHLFASLHSTSGEHSNFSYHASPAVEVPLWDGPGSYSGKLDSILSLVEEHAPDFRAADGVSGSTWPNVSRQRQMFQYGVLSLLFEGFYNTPDYGPHAGEPMTPERHMAMGRGFALALHDFFLVALESHSPDDESHSHLP